LYLEDGHAGLHAPELERIGRMTIRIARFFFRRSPGAGNRLLDSRTVLAVRGAEARGGDAGERSKRNTGGK